MTPSTQQDQEVNQTINKKINESMKQSKHINIVSMPKMNQMYIS